MDKTSLSWTQSIELFQLEKSFGSPIPYSINCSPKYILPFSLRIANSPIMFEVGINPICTFSQGVEACLKWRFQYFIPDFFRFGTVPNCKESVELLDGLEVYQTTTCQIRNWPSLHLPLSIWTALLVSLCWSNGPILFTLFSFFSFWPILNPYNDISLVGLLW